MRLDRYGCPQQVTANSTRARNGSWGKLVQETSDPMRPLPHLVHLGIGHQSTLMGAGWVSQVEGATHDKDP